MPVIGEFHTTYWENSDTNVAPVRLTRGGYPVWQSGVVIGTAFGGLALFWDRASDWWRWCWRLVSRSYRFNPEQRAVVLKTLAALEHPAYEVARGAVRKTARTVGFNRPEAWKDLSRELKASAGGAENAFRHLEACRLVRANLLNSTVTNPECHLITELAYQGFAWRGK